MYKAEVKKIDEFQGYVYLTGLDDSNNETSEKMMLPITINSGYDWQDSPKIMKDIEVQGLLLDIVKNLQEQMQDFDTLE